MSSAKKHMAALWPVDGNRSWYTLVLLTLSYALSYIDRQMLNLLVDPIKVSLEISDTEFSLVQGTAFVLAYLVAVPIFGRLVDITNRRNILIFGVCSWSVCTALMGLADSYAELFLARVGLGFAEACIFPVSLSLIMDMFSPQRTARAMSIFTIGTAVGAGFSLVAGALVIGFAGELRYYVPAFQSFLTWQMAFVTIGLPGICFALVLFSTSEPPRRSTDGSSTEVPMDVWDVLSFIWTRRQFYGRVYLAIGMIAVPSLCMPSWYPAFLMRSHELTPAQTGYQLGAVSVVAAISGTLMGPSVANWLARMGYGDAQLRAAAFSLAALCLSSIAIPLSASSSGALAAAAAVVFFTNVPLGITAAALQTATPNRMRGVVGAMHTFVAQIIGYMIGPTLIALMTDKVFGDPQKIGYSIQIVLAGATAIGTALMFSALRHHLLILASMERRDVSDVVPT